MFKRRIKEVWSEVGSRGKAGVLISSPEFVRYLTGFTGAEAPLLLSGGKGYLMVDSRYASQALMECRGTVVVESKDKIAEISKFIKKTGIKKLVFEPYQLTVGDYERLKGSGGPEMAPAPEEIIKIRAVKDKMEIGLLKKAAAISSKSFLEIVEKISVGAEEREISLLLEYRIRTNGAEATPFHFIVASGQRGALPHGVATSKRIRKGEFITLDFGAVYKGYCSDETCTVITGKPDSRQKRAYQVVKHAHDEAINKVKPGIELRQIDSAARRVIKRAGWERFFGHGTGHGVGLAVHEEPRIAPQIKGRAIEGMVFTIEPGVYIPGWGGVRIEDMVVVTRQGCELMSSVPKELICV